MGAWRTAAIWVAFFACLFGGAALLMASTGALQALGVALLAAPVVLLAFLTLAHYARERRQPGPPSP